MTRVLRLVLLTFVEFKIFITQNKIKVRLLIMLSGVILLHIYLHL